MNEAEPATPELDIALLAGFRFRCRPDCGLCCYATPRVEPDERERLVQIAPEASFVGRVPDRFLAARPEGGACQFLHENRCAVHDARPHPCREFPVAVHVGTRLQATVVLSCPGIEPEGLLGPGTDAAEAPESLRPELTAIRERLDATTARRLGEAARRRRRAQRALERSGRWESEEAVRDRLRHDLPRPGAREFPVEEPPEAGVGLDRLPLYFDGRRAPVAIAVALGGWELLELRESGGVARSIGVVPPPNRPPAVDDRGERLLERYLDYWLRRDALFGTVHLAMLESSDGSPVGDWVSAELRAIGATVLARADVRARSRGRSAGVLREADVWDGIQATDQDLLDRPTWGDRL
jgi:Fe-S-cluster containining protein